MHKNKLSIIMPIFDVKGHLSLFKKALDGILNQSFKNWELIMAVEGGKYNATDINIASNYVKSIGDQRIKLYSLENKKSVGPGIMRNFCYKYATGDLLTFHDSDDFSYKNRFKVLIDEMNKNNYQVIASDILINFIEAPKNNRIKGFDGKTLDLFVEHRKIRAPIHMSSAIIKKSLFKEIGGFEHYRYSSDSIFAIKLGYFMESVAIDGHIPIIKKPLFVWNRRGNSITMDFKNAEILRKCIKKQRRLVQKNLHKLIGLSGPGERKKIKHILGIEDNLLKDCLINLKEIIA